MNIAYICHPISGDVSGNLGRIRQIARDINLNEPDVIPFVPYAIDVACLDDTNATERARGIANGLYLLRSGIVNECRVYGDRISKGMAGEIEIAKEMGIEVKYCK